MTPATVHPSGVIPQGLVDKVVDEASWATFFRMFGDVRPSSAVVVLLSDPVPAGGAS